MVSVSIYHILHIVTKCRQKSFAAHLESVGATIDLFVLARYLHVLYLWSQVCF